jgi:hypothetical protein
MRRDYYILDESGEPVEVDDVLVWAPWFETSHDTRVVLQTRVDRRGRVEERPLTRGRGGVQVSTIFLALDHAFDDGPPVLWETMVFGGPLHGEMMRYRSKLAALTGHERMIARVQAIRRLPRRVKRAISKRNAGRSLTFRERRQVARFERRSDVD